MVDKCRAAYTSQAKNMFALLLVTYQKLLETRGHLLKIALIL